MAVRKNLLWAYLKGVAGFFRLLPKEASYLGQSHLCRRALKQFETKLLLQIMDLPAQRWLRHSKSLGSAAEIQRISYSQEVAEVAQFHR